MCFFLAYKWVGTTTQLIGWVTSGATLSQVDPEGWPPMQYRPTPIGRVILPRRSRWGCEDGFCHVKGMANAKSHYISWTWVVSTSNTRQQYNHALLPRPVYKQRRNANIKRRYYLRYPDVTLYFLNYDRKPCLRQKSFWKRTHAAGVASFVFVGAFVLDMIFKKL